MMRNNTEENKMKTSKTSKERVKQHEWNTKGTGRKDNRRAWRTGKVIIWSHVCLDVMGWVSDWTGKRQNTQIETLSYWASRYGPTADCLHHSLSRFLSIDAFQLPGQYDTIHTAFLHYFLFVVNICHLQSRPFLICARAPCRTVPYPHLRRLLTVMCSYGWCDCWSEGGLHEDRRGVGVERDRANGGSCQQP